MDIKFKTTITAPIPAYDSNRSGSDDLSCKPDETPVSRNLIQMVYEDMRKRDKTLPSAMEISHAYAVCLKKWRSQLFPNGPAPVSGKDRMDAYVEFNKCEKDVEKMDAMIYFGEALAMYALAVVDEKNVGCISQGEFNEAVTFGLSYIELLKVGRLDGKKIGDESVEDIKRRANDLIELAHITTVENYMKDTGNNY